MNVNLNDDAMKQLVAKAIFDGLGEEQRQALVEGAIASLLNDGAKDHRGYGTNRTVLQEMFNDAVREAARQIVTSKIAEDSTLKAQLDQLFTDVARRFFKVDGEYNAVVETLASQMVSAFTRDRY